MAGALGAVMGSGPAATGPRAAAHWGSGLVAGNGTRRRAWENWADNGRHEARGRTGPSLGGARHVGEPGRQRVARGARENLASGERRTRPAAGGSSKASVAAARFMRFAGILCGTWPGGILSEQTRDAF